MNIDIETIISTACPQLVIGKVSCKVKNSESDNALWTEINNAADEFRQKYTLEQINKIPAIQATRQAYKTLGKDPNRYRPSAEALCRRVVKNMDLYRINTLVDIINLISIKSGYSIGGFDTDKIQGNLLLTVGSKDDVFDAIGRGLLNIEGLPVYKDSQGGIGTPTSDNERTKISMETTGLLMLINAYSGGEGLQQTIDFTVKLLKKYAQAESFEIETLKV